MARKQNELTKFVYEKDNLTGYYRIKALRNINIVGSLLLVEAGDYGGLISDPTCLSQEGECWIDYNAIVTNSKITDSVIITGYSKITNSIISDKVRVFENAVISDSKLSENVQVFGNSSILNGCNISGNVTVYGDSIITFDVNLSGKMIIRDKAYIAGPLTIHNDSGITINDNINYDIKNELLLRYGKPDSKNRYTVYKIVRSTNEDYVYKSWYDENFVYDFRKTRKAECKYFVKTKQICGDGLHVSFNENYSWYERMASECDTILTCKVDVDDVIALKNDKARVKKLEVIDIRNYPLDKELSFLKVNHGLNSKYLIPMVYNNKTNKIIHDYKLILNNTLTSTLKLDIDNDNDSIDNYNLVLMGNTPDSITDELVIYPKTDKHLIVGNNTKDIYTIEHSLNSKNMIISVYNFKTYEEVTRECDITFIDNNKINIKFDHVISSKEEYKVLLIKPQISNTKVISNRGISAYTPRADINIIVGKDINKDNHSIVIDHDYNTFDIVTSLIDIDAKEIITNYELKRINKNQLLIIFKDKTYINHQYAVFITFA